MFLFWFGICSVRVRHGSLSARSGGRWCTWGSLINSSRPFISSLMDLVRAYQGLDYLPLAMGRGWLHMRVWGMCLRGTVKVVASLSFACLCAPVCFWTWGWVFTDFRRHLTSFISQWRKCGGKKLREERWICYSNLTISSYICDPSTTSSYITHCTIVSAFTGISQDTTLRRWNSIA